MTRDLDSPSDCKIEATLSVSADDPFDHEELTRMLGRVPDRAWKKGDALRGDIVYPHHGWHWQLIDYQSTPHAHEVIESCVVLLREIETELKGAQLAFAEARFMISLAAYFDEVTPSVHLGHELLSTLAALGVTISVDLYHLPGDSKEPR